MAINFVTYKTEVTNYLGNKNIILDEYSSHYNEFATNMGVLLSVLKKDTNFDKPVNILTRGDVNENEAPNEATANIIICSSLSMSDEQLEHYEHVELIEKYFDQELDVKIQLLVGRDDETETSILVLGDVYQKVYMILLALIPKLLPSIFTKEDTIKSKDILQSFIDMNGLVESAEKLGDLSDIDFDSIEKEHIINSFSEAMVDMDKQRRNRQMDKLREYRENMSAAMSDYNVYLKRYNETNSNLNAAVIDATNNIEKSKELMESLTSLRGFHFVETMGNTLLYDVVAPLQYIDTEIYKSNSSSIDKSCFRNINESYRKDMKKLLDEIFLARDRYEVIVSARFKLEFDDIGYISIDSNATSTVKRLYPYAMPSPHGMKYRCYGDFANTWTEALQEGDYFAAIQQTYSYTQNLNWTDLTVCSYFVEEIMTEHVIHDKKADKYYNAKEIFKQWKEKKEDK